MDSQSSWELETLREEASKLAPEGRVRNRLLALLVGLISQEELPREVWLEWSQKTKSLKARPVISREI